MDTPNPKPTDPYKNNDNEPYNDKNTYTKFEQYHDKTYNKNTPINYITKNQYQTTFYINPKNYTMTSTIQTKYEFNKNYDKKLLNQHELLPNPKPYDDKNNVSTNKCNTYTIKKFEVTPNKKFTTKIQTLPQITITNDKKYIITFLTSINNTPNNLQIIKFDTKKMKTYKTTIENIKSKYDPNITTNPTNKFVMTHD